MRFDMMKRADPGVRLPGSALTNRTILGRSHVMADSQSTTAPVTYKDIPGFPGYRVGDDGSVWSRRRSPIVLPEYRWKLLKYWVNEDGHLHYGIYSDGKIHNRFGHQLVLMAFVSPCPKGMECCHENGNPSDNRLSNLRWDTRKSNSEDCIRHGRRPRGKDHGRAKIVDSDIPVIRQMIASGSSKASVARKYGISSQQVRRIAERIQWKHVI